MYARQLGVSEVGVGFMYTILPFVGLVAKPSAGALADKFHAGKTLFLIGILLTAVFFGSMGFIPKKETDSTMSLDCSPGMTLLKTCDITDNCTLERLDLENDDTVSCTVRSFLSHISPLQPWRTPTKNPVDEETREETETVRDTDP